MRVDILTLFPEMFPPVLGHSIIGRARKKGLLQVCCHQLRDFSPDPRGRVDDTVFGGGKGMLLAAEPFARGIDQLRAHLGWQPHILYMSPRGKVLAQEDAKRLAQEPGLVLLCGHYEGVDQRAVDEWIDEEISIGDYVLTGGELAAMVVIDCLSRHIPGVLGSGESAQEESFSDGLLEYPQYTRPALYEGREVPEVLLSGHDANIRTWRRERSLDITRERRPELLERAPLTQQDRVYLGWEEMPPKRPRRKKKRPQEGESAQNLPENP